MRALGVATKSRSKLLGVDYSGGSSVRRTVQNARLKKADAKKRMLRRFGGKAAARVVKTGIGPGIRYGAGVVGASSSAIQSARRITCTSISEMRGRSQFGRLQLAEYDVGALMATDPLVEWAKGVWDGLASRKMMAVAWRAAMVHVGPAIRPFQVARGPAGAMVASAMRLGWKIPSPFCFLDQGGRAHDLDKVCPLVIGQLAQEALMINDAKASGLAATIGGPPDLEPLKDFLRTRGMRNSPVGASLRALGEGGWWPQARLFEAGIEGVTDPHCRACIGLRGTLGPAHGTLHHRCVGCPATRSLRETSARHQDAIARASSLVHSSEPLYQHGIPLLDLNMEVPMPVIRPAGGLLLPPGFSFTGDAFTDGALRGGGPRRARRSGWAAVLVTGCGKVIGGIYGPCPDAFPSSLRAELWAILHVLQMAIPPLTIWTDSQGAVDGWEKGKDWACAACRPAADLWRQIWRLLDDIGIDGLAIRKVKGHATEADVEAGRSTDWERQCNDHADAFAKRGVEAAEGQLPSDEMRARYQNARQWYSWLATLIGHWPDDTQKKVATTTEHQRARPEQVPTEVPVAPPELKVEDLALNAGLPHALELDGAMLRCTKCKKDTPFPGDPCLTRGFAKRKCLGRVMTARAASVPTTVTKANTNETASAGSTVPAVGLVVGSSSSSSSSTHPPHPPLQSFEPSPMHRNSLGHELYSSSGLVWCYRCGVRGWKLRDECRGQPTNRCLLERLKHGLHPVTKEALGPATRIYR